MANFMNLTIQHINNLGDGNESELVDLDISLNFDNVLYVTDATDGTYLITLITGKVLTIGGRIGVNARTLNELGVFRR